MVIWSPIRAGDFVCKDIFFYDRQEEQEIGKSRRVSFVANMPDEQAAIMVIKTKSMMFTIGFLEQRVRGCLRGRRYLCGHGSRHLGEQECP